MKKISIAIDGPSASGKSSVAKIIAKKLNYVYIDTGAMYRCVGYYCLKNNIDLKDERAVIDILGNIKITMDSSNNVYLNDTDVSEQIRQDKVSMSASEVSKYQEVRNFLVKQQRAILLDTSDLEIEEVVGKILELVEQKLKEV